MNLTFVHEPHILHGWNSTFSRWLSQRLLDRKACAYVCTWKAANETAQTTGRSRLSAIRSPTERTKVKQTSIGWT